MKNFLRRLFRGAGRYPIGGSAAEPVDYDQVSDERRTTNSLIVPKPSDPLDRGAERPE